MKIKALLLLMALALVGCSADDSTEATSYNSADIAFLQGMIPHHQQAIEMSELAVERAAAEPVKAMAVRISQQQSPEIATMQALLTEFGKSPGSAEHAVHGTESDHPGMLNSSAMTTLEQADGDQFDRLFVAGMIEHHQGAIQMAEDQLRDGQNPQVKALSQEIASAQRAEIRELEALL